MKKGNVFRSNLFFIFFLFLVFLISCKKEEEIISKVTDIDGNEYHTVTIGTQVWMVENLNVTHYRNGYPIPIFTNNTTWNNISIGGYCNYENNPNNSSIYGKLYNWYAVNDIQNIAPIGWHIPTDAEWDTLISFLGGKEVAGGKLKEAGFTHWFEPNKDATNESGFTALPGGLRYSDGTFYCLGYQSFWWSSTEYSHNSAMLRTINFLYGSIGSYTFGYAKNTGYSVRCLKDK